MDSKTLYDLPKDILVKLIMTIEKDAVEKFERELENKEIAARPCDICNKQYLLKHPWYCSSINTSHHVCFHCWKEYPSYSYKKLCNCKEEMEHIYGGK